MASFQRTQNTQNDRTCNSATCPLGMLWDLSADQQHENLNSIAQTRYSDLEIHSLSAFRFFPATAPQPGRITSTSHATWAQRRWRHRSLALSVATYHFYDAEVGGPQKEPLNVTFRKALPQFTKTGSPKKLRTVSVLSRISHLVSLQNKTTERFATIPYNHHVAT